ncbi:MAG: hypothetical protein D6706_06680 [Chloroflexi bacterium]|nr:MAG: hypothetical protein D6706_06680 [Chloroflexota bacterium]
MNQAQINALQKLPALRGAPLSIVMAMLIASTPLRAAQLETFTGYGNQAITRGLRTLEHLQAIVRVKNGYLLTPYWKQLMLFENHENHELTAKNHGNHDLPIGNGYGGSNKLLDYPTTTITNGTVQNHDFPAAVPKIVDNPVDNSAIPVENTTTSEITLALDEITSVPEWLTVAGIDNRSHHWKKIIGMNHPVDYVAAHCLELLASNAGLTTRKIGTGALIYRLEHSWAAPAMRCTTCLHQQDECRCAGRTARIPAELQDIIRR